MKNKYYYSLLIFILFGFVAPFIELPNGSLIKALYNTHIYLSLAFIPLIDFNRYNNFLYENSKKFYYLIIIYGLFNILRDSVKGEILTLLGNSWVGPSFLVPLFLFWGIKKSSVYWLNKTLIFALIMGIFVQILSLLFEIKLTNIFLSSTAFAILNYDYVNKRSKVLIIIGTILSFYYFWIDEVRIEIVKLIISTLIVIFLRLKLNKTYKFFGFFLLLIPLYFVYDGIVNKRSLFIEMSDSDITITSEKELLTDTRTFLYLEIMEDLIKNDSYVFGKGPLGRYYSNYFLYNEGDSFNRIVVEVGVLQYLLKGGFIYLILVISLFYTGIKYSLKNSKSLYLRRLAFLLIFFILLSFIENVPKYSFKFVLNWILLGICLSKYYIDLKDEDIRHIVQGKKRFIQ